MSRTRFIFMGAIAALIGLSSFASGVVTPKVGNGALSLNGVDGCMTVGVGGGNISFSVTAWAKTPSGDWVVGNGEGNDLRVLGTPLFQYYDGVAGFNNLWGATNVANDVWHFLAMVHDDVAGTNTLYVDGAVDGTPLTGLFDPNFAIAAIGSREGTSGFFSGGIDEVMVFNTALSAGQIAGYYNGGAGVSLTASEPGLVAGWNFDDGTPNDIKGSANGTLVGGASIVLVPEPAALSLLALAGLFLRRR